MSHYQVHEEDVRMYLWQQARRIQDRKGTDVWGPEDTSHSVKLGWMLANIPGRNEIELYVLTRQVDPKDIVRAIRDMASYDYICSKAVSIMTAQLMRYPDYPFTYRGL